MKGQFGLDLQGDPGSIYKVDGKHRRGYAVRQCHARRRAQPGPGPRQPCLRFRAQAIVRVGPLYRHDPSLRISMAKNSAAYDHGVTGLGAANLAAVPFDPEEPAQHRERALRLPKTRTPGDSLRPRAGCGASRCMRDDFFTPQGTGRRRSAADLVGRHPARRQLRRRSALGARRSGASRSVAGFRYRLFATGRDDPGAARPIAGAYDYSAFTQPGEPQVLRFWLKDPNDPPSPGRWMLAPDEYAVGFAGDYRNTNGGVALGYGYASGRNAQHQGLRGRAVDHGAKSPQQSGAAQPARTRRPARGSRAARQPGGCGARCQHAARGQLFRRL